MFNAISNLLSPLLEDLGPNVFEVGEADETVIRIRPLVDPRPPAAPDPNPVYTRFLNRQERKNHEDL